MIFWIYLSSTASLLRRIPTCLMVILWIEDPSQLRLSSLSLHSNACLPHVSSSNCSQHLWYYFFDVQVLIIAFCLTCSHISSEGEPWEQEHEQNLWLWGWGSVQAEWKIRGSLCRSVLLSTVGSCYKREDICGPWRPLQCWWREALRHQSHWPILWATRGRYASSSLQTKSLVRSYDSYLILLNVCFRIDVWAVVEWSSTTPWKRPKQERSWFVVWWWCNEEVFGRQQSRLV